MMKVGTDFSFHLPLRLNILGIVEGRNRAMAERGANKVAVDGRMKCAVLDMLVRFLETEVTESCRRGDFRAMIEHRTVLVFLIDAGCTEFKSHVQAIDIGLARIRDTARELEGLTGQARKDRMAQLKARGWPEWEAAKARVLPPSIAPR
jgi:hypothetical protein